MDNEVAAGPWSSSSCSRFVQPPVSVWLARTASRQRRIKTHGIRDGTLYFRAGTPISEDVRTALSSRELEILYAVADGKTAKEIAASLRLSERTVKWHLSKIFRKLDVVSRAQAVAVALERGYLRRLPGS